jgi:hypothetical protein
VIKGNIMAGIMKLAVGNGRGFSRLNRALFTPIPKKQDMCEIGYYHPISLVSFFKLLPKFLANHLRKSSETRSVQNSQPLLEGGLYMTILC